MPAQIFGAPAAAVMLFQALYGQAPSNPIFSNNLQVIAASSPELFAITVGNQFQSEASASMATRVLTNVGITATTIPAASFTALQTALTSLLEANKEARGLVIYNALKILTGLETDATFGSVAQVFNQSVTNSFVYASNTSNTQTQTLGSITTTPPLSVNAGDNITGTSGNDNINANLFFNAPSGGFFQTLQSGDNVNGGAGTDTLTAGFNNGGAQTITPAGLTSIENLSINATGTFAAFETPASTTINMVNATGLTSLGVTNSQVNGDVILSNLGSALTSVSLSNALGAVVLQNTATSIAGTADAVALNLSQVTNATGTFGGAAVTVAPLVGLAGYETINVTSSGAVTNQIRLANGTAGVASTVQYSQGTTVNVAGDRAIEIGTGNSTNGITFNASTLAPATGTAGLTVTANAAGFNNNVNVTGSASGDLLILGANYDTNDVFNGGAGTDAIRVNNANAANVTAAQTNLSNLEVLSILNAVAASGAGLGGTNVNPTFTPAAFGGATILELRAASGAAYQVNYAGGTSGLTLLDSNTGAATLRSTGSGLTDVLNVTSGNATSASLTQGALGSVGFETINLASSGALSSTNTVASVNMGASAAVETLNVTGARAITITGTVQADVVDGSALTAALTMGGAASSAQINNTDGSTITNAGVRITGGAASDVLFGGAGSDVINGGAGDDTLRIGTQTDQNQSDILTGAAGADRFFFSGVSVDTLARSSSPATAAAAGASGASNIVRITDFATASDKIVLNNTTANFTSVSFGTQTVATADNVAAIYAALAVNEPAIAASTQGGAAVVRLLNVSAGLAAGTYVYMNDEVAGVQNTEDFLINVTGVTGTISATDFAFA